MSSITVEWSPELDEKWQRLQVEAPEGEGWFGPVKSLHWQYLGVQMFVTHNSPSEGLLTASGGVFNILGGGTFKFYRDGFSIARKDMNSAVIALQVRSSGGRRSSFGATALDGGASMNFDAVFQEGFLEGAETFTVIVEARRLLGSNIAFIFPFSKHRDGQPRG
ncbi:MAG TPA: hypothetical protein VMD77_08725 [Candidatus Baltobacteraceae bacterium]|nr:hypothetical protein [Candidatus Baltobacteraceae bacterium]